MWGQEWRVVGVARTGKYRSLNEPPQPFIYVSETQAPGRSFGAVIRVAGDPRSIAQAVERTAMAIDPLLKPTAALTMTQYTAAAMAMPRMAAILLAGLGAAAILLAAIGIYGVMSFSVSQRTREIGVRMALGASASHVLVMFVRQGMLLALAGVAVGVAGGLAGAHVLSSLLVGVSASDPFTYGLVAALLAGIAMFACWLPARRATKIDPIVALRCE